jgi:hypothetical protein
MPSQITEELVIPLILEIRHGLRQKEIHKKRSKFYLGVNDITKDALSSMNLWSALALPLALLLVWRV